MSAINRYRLQIIAAFAALYLVWGSTYIAIVFALDTIPPFLLAGVRFLVAGIILLAWCRYKKQVVPPTKDILKIGFTGILLLSFGSGAVMWVEQYLASGLTAIIWASLPMWFVLLDKRLWRYHFNNKRLVAGILIGFAGVLLLFWDEGLLNGTSNHMETISFFVLIGGTIIWAIGSLYTKYASLQGTATTKAAIQMIAAGLFSTFLSFISQELRDFELLNLSLSSAWGLLYLITMGSLVAFLAYVWLISVKSPALVGTHAYVNPVVAVLLGWWWAHETITASHLIGMSIILMGMLLINTTKAQISKP